MMQDNQPIHYIQYLELIKRITSIAGRLNDIESIIGGTKRKWRDEVDVRLAKLEAMQTPAQEEKQFSGYATESPKSPNYNNSNFMAMAEELDEPSPTESLADTLKQAWLYPKPPLNYAWDWVAKVAQDRIEQAYRDGTKSGWENGKGQALAETKEAIYRGLRDKVLCGDISKEMAKECQKQIEGYIY
jgi:hypothetical protein